MSIHNDARGPEDQREGHQIHDALHGAARLVGDSNDIVAEGLDCAKALVDDVGCKVNHAGRCVFYVSPKPACEFTHCLL